MGIDKCTYLTAYALVTFNKIENTEKVFGCENHREYGYSDYDYCPKCGSRTITWNEIESKYPYMYEVLEELDIDEGTFCEVNNDEDQSMTVLIPNIGEVSIDDGYLQLEISPYMPESSIKAFLETYNEELDKIRSSIKYVKSCVVKFGVVQYYS